MQAQALSVKAKVHIFLICPRPPQFSQLPCSAVAAMQVKFSLTLMAEHLDNKKLPEFFDRSVAGSHMPTKGWRVACKSQSRQFLWVQNGRVS